MANQDLLESLRIINKSYSPNDLVKDQIARVGLIPLIGPCSVGKTSTIRAVAEQNYIFGAVRITTTRPKRQDETGKNAPRFLPNNKNGFRTILDEVIKGEMVQMVIHPTNGYIYATHAREYTRPFNMLEVLSSAVGGLALYNFRDFKPIGLVAKPEDWWPRIDTFKQIAGSDETEKRLTEAVSSLEWLLQNPEVPIVVNRQGHLDKTAEKVIGLSLGTQPLNPDNRRVAEELLESINFTG